jgi:tetrahydromethanopterin S-methyltransferase subunit B
MGWGSFLKATVRLGGNAVKATATSAGKAVIHPATTLRNLGTGAKSAAIGGAAAYVGWEKLTTDKSVVGIVSDAVIGEGASAKVSDTIDSVVNEVKGIKDSVSGLTDNVNNTINNLDSKWNGMSNFLSGIFSGNGANMFGSFFNNLARGNVSGLSIAGLVVSALLVFGRFGWLGKIAGAVLGMMMIGNNANMSQSVSVQKQKENPNEKTSETIHNGGLRR